MRKGKPCVGRCLSMPGVALPFGRLLKRNAPVPTGLFFLQEFSHLFDRVLKEEGLKFDGLGQGRTPATYDMPTSPWADEGADIYEVAEQGSGHCRADCGWTS